MADSLWDIYIKFCIDIYTYKPIKMLYLPLIYKSLTTCISFHHWQWTNNFVSAESALKKKKKKKKKKPGPDGWLLELDYFPCCKVVCLWFMCFCCWGVFPVLTLYSPRSIVWGLFFFSSPSSCYAVFFFNSLSSCPVYPLVIYVCCVCMDRLMANFTGTCD